jgi:hypothetical protein
MLILFDHGTPRPLKEFLQNYTVKEAKEQGWDTLKNGDLLKAAEDFGFDLLITTDKNLLYQQNMVGRKIAVLVLGNAQWPVLRLHTEIVTAAVDQAVPANFAVIDIPV